jgi:acyl transferase domain-containing protein/NADPH:quinone reductase-like Zn-dependent oxidoreductase/NAD(P)-dependent dehydrogenase (short-subunit alcohol dehydrogenase family)/acyl carrier protein
MLALEHDELPRSLHFDEPNPDIPFADLNLSVCAEPLALPRNGGVRYAGVSSLGFGGTNAHVILADPPPAANRDRVAIAPQFLLLSAQGHDSLADLARQYSVRLAGAGAEETQRVVAAAGHRREFHSERLAIPFDGPKTLLQALEQAGAKNALEMNAIAGTAVERAAPVAFVFSGNGGQFPGMGRAAYEANPVFRAQFNAIDRIFLGLSGWSLAETMFSSGLAARLQKTSVAQPLIFAIQVAARHCLAELGLAPDMVLGHSMGEIAAAEAAGVLDLESAVQVIYFRSLHQEVVRGGGGMAAVFGPREVIDILVQKAPGLAIAAENSPRSFTVAGPLFALDQAAKISRAHKARMRRLDLAYPFHSDLMAPVEAPLLADLEGLRPGPSRASFLSTVDVGVVSGGGLDAKYWWRNVREPVRFMEGVQLAMRLGARVFVEIGPGPVLLADLRKIAELSESPIATLDIHEQKPISGDPFRHAVALALSLGARIDAKRAFGSDPGPVANLPVYPWKRKPYRLAETSESTGWLRVRPSHPLIGARLSSDSLEWRAQLDPLLVPGLADHRIDGQVLLPGAAFAEMALAVARDWTGAETATIKGLEIVQPMVFAPNTSREILCRAAPVTGMIEIMSRARLSDAPWSVHAKAKVIFQVSPPAVIPVIPGARAKPVSGAGLYATARRSGLEFGPAYQQVFAASRIGEDVILVDLVAADSTSEYGLDPARLDSCFHGLILLFADNSSSQRPAAYLPVHFGEIRLEKPGAAIARARIDVRRHDARAIVADFALIDADGGLIASLHGARYQAVRSRGTDDLASHSLVPTLILADEPTAIPHDPPLSLELLLEAALPDAAAARDSLPPDLMLIEGWATAAAYRCARMLAIDGAIAPDRLIAAGRFPAARRGWFVNLLVALETSGLIRSDGEKFVLTDGVSLPAPRDILRSIAEQYPRRSAELLLAARSSAVMEALAEGEDASDLISGSMIESFETGSVSVVAAAELLVGLLRRAEASWPRDRALRILQIGHGPLSWHAAALANARGARLTILDPNPRRLERARLAFTREPGISFADGVESLQGGSFDLIIAADALYRVAPDAARLARIVEMMAPDALLAAIEPAPSLFREVVFGLLADRLSGTESKEKPASSQSGWAERFAATCLHGLAVKTVGTAAGPALLVAGQMPPFAGRRNLPAKVVIAGRNGSQQAESATALAGLLGAAGVACTIEDERSFEQLPFADADTIVFLAPIMTHGTASTGQLAERCMALKNFAAHLGKHKVRLWIESPGALRAGLGAADPVEAGFWAFTRSFANEFPALDVRRVDLDQGLPARVRARRLADVILSGTAETEVILDSHSTRVVRLQARDPAAAAAQEPPAPASRLEKGKGTGLGRIRWVPAERRPPGPGEVEIAVAATGLNFRDVMWGLSVLPDEMLEDGLAGPVLGLECAGHIVATGPNVEGFNPGDSVVAITGGAFATHVTVDAATVARVPEGLPLEAAVTIPVAFLTAYYALVTCARLTRGEWVLIHGGAGGVGLAALQVARWRGARVIATASTVEKRDLVAALGAEHVFDARAHGFADGVRQATGGGVAVVLNSLSGEAMELSVGLLAPFGRFVELGKRDFLANTHIGLRPFRNNLTYFGVDLDQLMLVQPDTSRQLFKEVIELIAQGEFFPLPYRTFRADEFIDAMRLMQQSGHVGKIVITPPEPGMTGIAPRRQFTLAPDKTHLVTGGCGGFGLATARWLAEHGARHLVLAGRSGAASPEAREAIASLGTSGVNVCAEALDVSDAAAVEALIKKIGRTLPPLAGVFHAAMVLDDALITNLEAERLKKVLAPKVMGAENLDRLTRDLPLEHFVLFSSATTAIGNPGQGSYVAANGFLEGLARQRRAAGRPALAIAWGGIEDVGLLARNRFVKDMLASRAGVKPMLARDALNLMGEALAHPSTAPEEAVLVIGEMNWPAARAHLPLLQAPAFSRLVRADEAASADTRGKVDIRALVATLPLEEARKEIIGVIVEEIAHILRLPQENLNRGKPLAEIGLDSLMAVELAATLEERLNFEAPLSTPASGFTVMELADHLLGLCINPASEEESVAQALTERHLGKGIDPAALETLTVLVEDRTRDLTQILR